MKLATKTLLTCIAAAMIAGSVNAAVIVTDNGTTAPTIGVSDTGLTDFSAAAAASDVARFGWDATESFTQTFTVPNAGVIDSIYIAYNGFNDGETITLNLSVNGSPVATGLFLNGNNFSGNATTDAATPVYWMQFDLSAENVVVAAGPAANSFTLTATADTGDSWALAPIYTRDLNYYAGGAMSANFTAGTLPSNSDMGFVVTVVPEPGSIAMFGIGGLCVLRRRRK